MTADRRRSPEETGFMLIEALVALAIVAMMAGLVFETVSQFGRAAAMANERRQAALLARSIMAAATVATTAPPVSASGTDNGLTWSISGSAYRTESESLPLRIVTVTITSRASGAQLVRLDSLRPDA